MGRGGFEPPKSLTTDLQSVPFGRSGTCPLMILNFGAGDWNRTRNLLITNQLLCQLSYTSKVFFKKICLVPRGGIEPPTQGFSVPCSTDWATEAYKFLINAYIFLYKHFIMATRKGLEPSTSSVTGWRTNHLYYRAKLLSWMVGLHGLEPRTNRLWADRSNQLS